MKTFPADRSRQKLWLEALGLDLSSSTHRYVCEVSLCRIFVVWEVICQY